MSKRVLNQEFFNRSAVVVAQDLLGQFLVTKGGAFMITETEAYEGFKDKASHASRGQTPRNLPMWGEAGRWYVYFVYGNHFMLNIVTGTKDYPAAVLIRGVSGIVGPGRLTKQLKITKKFNNLKAVKKNGLWLEDRSIKINARDIKRVPRVGVSYAGPTWANKPYRFILKHHLV